MYQRHSPLELYEYVPTPIPHPGSFYAIISPPQTYLGISPNTGNHIGMKTSTLLNCLQFKATYYCPNNNVNLRSSAVDCLSALYSGLHQASLKRCAEYVTFLEHPTQVVAQLSPYQFSWYARNLSRIAIDCQPPHDSISDELAGHLLVELPIGCRARTRLYDFSPEGLIVAEAPNQLHMVANTFNASAWFPETPETTLIDVLSDLVTIPEIPITINDIRTRLKEFDFSWGFELPSLNFGLSTLGITTVLILGLILAILACWPLKSKSATAPPDYELRPLNQESAA